MRSDKTINSWFVAASDLNRISNSDTVISLTIHMWKLYCASEQVPSEKVFQALQDVVVTTKNLVNSLTTPEKEQFEVNYEDAIIACLRVRSSLFSVPAKWINFTYEQLTALVQEHAFSSITSPSLQRSLHESCFVEAQAIRGLLLASTEVRRLAAAGGGPALDQAQASVNALLKKAAEQVRLIAKGLKEYAVESGTTQLSDEQIMALFNKGIALMSNARDKYIAKAREADHFADDEKQILELIAKKIQALKSMLQAYLKVRCTVTLCS